ncbi:MAG TPA: HU family DNA-binding protein [Opitutales bacterium]|nr:HU family DNA-binding protein [Opitutales bacterium]
MKNEAINKAGLVTAVQAILGEDATRKCAEDSVNAVIEAIKESVKTGKSVQLVGFGTFSVAVRKARTGVNPRTGAKLSIPESKSVKFKAGAALKSL